MGRTLLNMIFACFFCCSAAGCFRITEIDGPAKDDDIWTGPGISLGGASGSVCYVTGIDYPAGFNWRESDAPENVRCSLTVFSDGIPMLKLPVGKAFETSADPDMHKVSDGHLYTWFCSEGRTSIRKDGKISVRYEGEESIRGLLNVKEDIYTLGVPRNGEGFIYRKNGEIIMERRTGYVFERLDMDNGKVCFAFSQPVTTAEGTSDRYYIVRNEKISMVGFSEETTKVWDIMSSDGNTCAAVSAGPWNTVTMIKGTEEKMVILPVGAEMTFCRMFPSGSDICIEGIYTREDDTIASGIWVGGEQYMLFETGQTISAICSSDDEICCALNPDKGNRSGIIFHNGMSYTMPSGYTCTGSTPLAVHDGTLYAALTSLDGSRPVIWKNGRTDSLKLNGPLCTIAICHTE